MGFFNFIKGPDINQGIQDCQQTPGAVLLDVRTPQEYTEGHIPGSKNIPLASLAQAGAVTFQKDTPLFVYCYSGGRSRQAADILKGMGYTNVKNLGGIASYTGKVEK